MSTSISEQKLQTETLSVGVDFLSRLSLGETLSTCAAAANVFVGSDPTPSTILSGMPSISGTTVTQKVTGGVAGVIYKIAYSVRTSLNNILVDEIKIAIIPGGGITPP